jgi:hypothetical protein
MKRLAPLAFVLSFCALPSRAQEAAPIAITIEAERTTLAVGDVGEVVAVIEADERASGPLLLTPTSDGPAIVVVRGRLLRADAEDPRRRPLRFHVPYVAHSAGDAVLRVRVDGWSCTVVTEGFAERRCQAVRVEASVTLTVR